MKVIQIISDSKMLVNFGQAGGMQPLTVMAVGWDTTKLVDDDVVKPTSGILVSGTTEYVAVTGAKKRIYVVEPIDLDKYAGDNVLEIPKTILEIVEKGAD